MPVPICTVVESPTLIANGIRSKWACLAAPIASLTPLEIDEHLAEAGAGMPDRTRHHDVVALQVGPLTRRLRLHISYSRIPLDRVF
ncbi:MAG: hypothetical protein ACM3U2_13075 [Deltaproteobacteria bacterium]